MGLPLFPSRSSALVGLDMSPTALRMVELVATKRGYRLERAAVEPLALGILVDGAVAKPEELSDAIRRCHRALGSKTKAVALGMPSEAVIFKRLDVAPGLSEEEIEQYLSTQLSNALSMEADDIAVDFQTLTVDSDADEAAADASTQVLAMATRKAKLEERVLPVEAAGLRVVVVDAETLALHNALDEDASHRGATMLDQNHALVQVGEHHLTLTVLRNGEAIYSRDTAVGFSQLVGEVVMRFGLSEEQARRIALNFDPAPPGFAALAAEFAENAVMEVRRALQLFMTSTAYVSVDVLYLYGEGAEVAGLAEAMAQAQSLPCHVLNPFAHIDVAPAAFRGSQGQATAFVVACGLAYRRFDL